MEDNETTHVGLHNLAPAPGARREPKRVGRGHGSGSGKTSGRGQKGQKARSGSHRMRAGFEGGQNPLVMAVGKQRGPHKKTSMPMGPFRTFTHGVNLRDLEGRFDAGAEVTPQALVAAGVLRRLRYPVKILAEGELAMPLTIHAHGFSAAARAKIEAAGGQAVTIGGDAEAEAPARRKRRRAAEPAAAEAVEAAPAETADEAPADAVADDAPGEAQDGENAADAEGEAE